MKKQPSRILIAPLNERSFPPAKTKYTFSKYSRRNPTKLRCIFAIFRLEKTVTFVIALYVFGDRIPIESEDVLVNRKRVQLIIPS